MASYRGPKCLDTLLSQINTAFPKRSKASDGWIGDTAHSARKSDHNPNKDGIVLARDFTHDPKNGFDSYKFADHIREIMDPRISYIISNSRIANPAIEGGKWRPYSGANKHDHHVHISIKDDPKLYDDPRMWDIGVSLMVVTAPASIPVSTAPETAALPDWRVEMVRQIIKWEARYDKAGNIQVYQPGDGSYEVGGVTSNSHPEKAAALKALVDAGKYVEAERMASAYIVSYTDPVMKWTTLRAIEFFLRDSYYNRGPDGAARILQIALGVGVDGDVGDKTLTALRKAQVDQVALLKRLRAARETYELQKYGRRENYWAGLTNRWNNCLNASLALIVTTAPVKDMAWVQGALNTLGANPPLEITGTDDEETRKMVTIFQTENGLAATGQADQNTIKEIDAHLNPAPPPVAVAPHPVIVSPVSFWDKLRSTFGIK